MVACVKFNYLEYVLKTTTFSGGWGVELGWFLVWIFVDSIFWDFDLLTLLTNCDDLNEIAYA